MSTRSDPTERTNTHSSRNRAFIDDVLRSRDERAVKRLFEEHFHLHAQTANRDRITWAELYLIANAILQRRKDELTLSEATDLFWQLYQSQYGSNETPAKAGEKQLLPKKTKSEQELAKLNQHIMFKQEKK